MASTHAWPIALCNKMNKNPNYGYILATNYIQEPCRGQQQQQQIIQVNQLEIDLSIGLALDCIRIRGPTRKSP
jgi:hypothetical protein